MANGIDSLEVTKVDNDKYRIVIKGEGLTLDAMLIGVGAEAIVQSLEAAGDPRPVLQAYKAKAAAKRGGSSG